MDAAGYAATGGGQRSVLDAEPMTSSESRCGCFATDTKWKIWSAYRTGWLFWLLVTSPTQKPGLEGASCINLAANSADSYEHGRSDEVIGNLLRKRRLLLVMCASYHSCPAVLHRLHQRRSIIPAVMPVMFAAGLGVGTAAALNRGACDCRVYIPVVSRLQSWESSNHVG